ncbi:MAG: tetratricopeptide repeat protein, partial [Gemmatimonadaceae bacterium]
LGIATARGGDAAVRRIREINGARADSAAIGPTTFATVGYTLLQRQRAADALPIFKHWTETAPNDAEAFNSLGDAYVRAGRLGLAARSYERALSLDPNLPSATESLRWLRDRGEGRGRRG